MKDDGTQREFDTGATRSSQAGRVDPEGFLSPLSIERYCQYLLKHQVQANGEIRESDNWQKGMPLASYVKGMWRHFLHFWTRHRGWEPMDDKSAADIQEDLCAIIFNAQGYLHELLKEERAEFDDLIDRERLEGEYPMLSYTFSGEPEEWPTFEPDPATAYVGDPIDLDATTETPPPPPETQVWCECCGTPGRPLAYCAYCTHCEGGADYNPINKN
jgi:hypothetical protein